MQLIVTVVNGILLGGVYGLAALGLSLIFGVMTIINLVHGEFVMLGAFACFWLWFLLGMNPFFGIFVAMLVLFVLAVFFYKVVISRVVGQWQLVSLILTFGLSLFLWNLAEFTFGATFRSVAYSTGSISFLGSYIPVNKIISFIVVCIVAGALFVFLKWTRIGKAIRAISQNTDIASISGINIDRIRMFGYGIGGALAGIAGGLISMQWAIFPALGQELILKCFAIVALGGMGSLPGALLGGVILGVAESVGTMYWDPIMAAVIAPLLVVLCFIFRPQGLFGEVERVD